MKTYVVKTTPDASLAEALDLMDLYQVTALPVVDPDGCPVGMIAEHDVMEALLPNEIAAADIDEAGKLRLRELRVSDVMSHPAIVVSETTLMAEVAQLMAARHLKRVPVIGEDGRVVGILSRVDVCQALLEGSL